MANNEIDIFAPVPLVYPAQSKHYFYCRDAVCEYVLIHGAVPLHPFRIFDYFLGDRVNRDLVRRGNNSIVGRADEIWVFGSEIADGVLLEIAHANKNSVPVKYHSIATRALEIERLPVRELSFEPELLERANNDIEGLRAVLVGEREFDSVVKR